MRVNSLNYPLTLLSNINRNGTQLNKLQTQMNLQKRIVVPSDDPIGSTRIAQMRREQASIEQYKTNIDRLAGSLAIQETQVDASSSELLMMMDKLREANNSNLSQSDMQGYATELKSMMDSVVALLNTKDEGGHYMFGGTITNQQPVVFDEATQQWRFQGNDKESSTQIANGVEIRATTDLAGCFGSDMETLNELQSLLNKMNDPDLKQADYADEISNMLGTLQTSSNQIAGLYTDLGGRQNNLTLMKDAHTDNYTINQEVMSGLEGLNPAEAMTQLSQLTFATQATFQTFLKISNLSLFNLG